MKRNDEIDENEKKWNEREIEKNETREKRDASENKYNSLSQSLFL